MLRDLMSYSPSIDWDSPLDEALHADWKKWVNSLPHLRNICIPRMYCSLSVVNSDHVEVHVFCDSSKEAVAAVAHLKVFSTDKCDVDFLLGKAKVAPAHGHTIPRLELCSAVLAIEIAEIVKDQLGLDSNKFRFYSDSQLVLGYISNDTKRFHVYVANRVSRIRGFSDPKQWNYIQTDLNPADVATRGLPASNLLPSEWLTGSLLLKEDAAPTPKAENFPLVNPDQDKEVRTTIITAKVSIKPSGLGCN